MADLPISFSAPMVCALLDGRKTQTRRTFSSLRGLHCRRISEFGRSGTRGYDWHFRDDGMRWHDLRHAELLPRLKYQAGDRLYVREHWRALVVADAVAPRDLPRTSRIAFDANPRKDNRYVFGRRRQAMHMPKWVSRLTLTVTDVHVERLQDISRDDAIAEGLSLASANMEQLWRWPSPFDAGLWLSPIAAYRSLWETINGPGAWDANPWVAAYTFTVHRGNIDHLTTGGENGR